MEHGRAHRRTGGGRVAAVAESPGQDELYLAEARTPARGRAAANLVLPARPIAG